MAIYQVASRVDYETIMAGVDLQGDRRKYAEMLADIKHPVTDRHLCLWQIPYLEEVMLEEIGISKPDSESLAQKFRSFDAETFVKLPKNTLSSIPVGRESLRKKTSSSTDEEEVRVLMRLREKVAKDREDRLRRQEQEEALASLARRQKSMRDSIEEILTVSFANMAVVSSTSDPAVGVYRSKGSANGSMLYQGAGGGRYYINSRGNKTYV